MRNFLRVVGVCSAMSCSLLGSAFAADMPTKAVKYTDGPWMQIFGGFVVAPGSQYGYAGGVFGINHNLYQDGWLFRIAGGDGHYSYHLAPGVNHGVDFQAGDVMIGYQKFFGNMRVTGYIGANGEDHHNSSDPNAAINGTRGGVKVQGEILAPVSQAVYLYGLGSYSTVWNNYFLMAKAGFNVSPIISFGPEFISLGNDRFASVRTGPFLGIQLTPAALLIFSGGYSWDTRRSTLDNHSGGYGSVHVQSTF